MENKKTKKYCEKCGQRIFNPLTSKQISFGVVLAGLMILLFYYWVVIKIGG